MNDTFHGNVYMRLRMKEINQISIHGQIIRSGMWEYFIFMSAIYKRREGL